MELLINGLESKSCDVFKDSTSAYKDVCKWVGIVCNGRRRVTSVKLYHISGTINLFNLPEHVKTFAISQRKEMTLVVNGTLDTSALPPELLRLYLINSRLNGTVDFRRLPPTLQELELDSNDFSGSVHLTSMPRELESLSLKGNEFCGSIQLTALPETLTALNLDDNVLSGSLNFSNLPDSLDFISLKDNCFTGSISLQRLPRDLQFLLLDGNNLSGQFVYTACPPDDLEEISAEGNLFAGTAIISKRSMSLVKLAGNPLEMVVDEFGQRSTAFMLRMLRETQAERA